MDIEAAIDRRIKSKVRAHLKRSIDKQKSEAFRNLEVWLRLVPYKKEELEAVYKRYCALLDERLKDIDLSEEALHRACEEEKAMVREIYDLVLADEARAERVFRPALKKADVRLTDGLRALKRLNNQIDEIKRRAARK